MSIELQFKESDVLASNAVDAETPEAIHSNVHNVFSPVSQEQQKRASNSMQHSRTPSIGFGIAKNTLDEYNFNNGEPIAINNNGPPATAPVAVNTEEEYQMHQQKLLLQQQALFKQYQSNLQAKKRQLENQRKNHYMSHEYNKALFTLSYLVSLQLRKYMEMFSSITKMRASDFQDPDIMKQKQEQIQNSLNKFKKHFQINLESLNQKEVNKKVSPKFTICFMDLAAYLGIKPKKYHKTDDADGQSDQQSFQGKQQYQHPQVIKEEKEENDIDEDEIIIKSDRNHVVKLNQQQDIQMTPNAAGPKQEKGAVPGETPHGEQDDKIDVAGKVSKSKSALREKVEVAGGESNSSKHNNSSSRNNHNNSFKARKISLTSEKSLSSKRERVHGSVEKEHRHHASQMSLGYSDISNAYNLHFQNDRFENQSLKSPSIGNYQATQSIQESMDEDMVEQQNQVAGYNITQMIASQSLETQERVPSQNSRTPFSRETVRATGGSGSTANKTPKSRTVDPLLQEQSKMIHRTLKSFHEQKNSISSNDDQNGTILKGFQNIKGEVMQSRKNYATSTVTQSRGNGRTNSQDPSEKPKTADVVKPKKLIVNRIRNEEKRKTMEIQPLFTTDYANHMPNVGLKNRKAPESKEKKELEFPSTKAPIQQHHIISNSNSKGGMSSHVSPRIMARLAPPIIEKKRADSSMRQRSANNNNKRKYASGTKIQKLELDRGAEKSAEPKKLENTYNNNNSFSNKLSIPLASSSKGGISNQHIRPIDSKFGKQNGVQLTEGADTFSNQPSLGGFNSTTHYLATNFEVEPLENQTIDWTRNAVKLTNKIVSEDKTKFFPRKNSKSVSKATAAEEYLVNQLPCTFVQTVNFKNNADLATVTLPEAIDKKSTERLAMFQDVHPLNKHQGYPPGPNPYLKTRVGSLGPQYGAGKKAKRTRNHNGREYSVRGISPLNLTHESQIGDSIVPNAHTTTNEAANNNIIQDLNFAMLKQKHQQRQLKPIPSLNLPTPPKAEEKMRMLQSKQQPLQPFSKHYLAIAQLHEEKLKEHKKKQQTLRQIEKAALSSRSAVKTEAKVDTAVLYARNQNQHEIDVDLENETQEAKEHASIITFNKSFNEEAVPPMTDKFDSANNEHGNI